MMALKDHDAMSGRYLFNLEHEDDDDRGCVPESILQASGRLGLRRRNSVNDHGT